MLSILTGCLSWGSKKADNNSHHYYALDVDRGSVASHFAENRVLRLKPVRISSHFRHKNIVFKVGDDEYRTQENHQFFSEPQEMFTELLKRWLQKSGLFSHIIIGGNAPADMVLETAITALYGDQREQFSPQAVLEMQFFLTAKSNNTSQALFQTGLRIEIDIDETTSPNVVKGWKQGLETLLATVEDDLSGYFSKRSP